MECGVQYVEWVIMMPMLFVALLDMMEVSYASTDYDLLIATYTVMEYYSTNHMFGDGGRPIYYNLQCSGCESHIRACSKNTYPYTGCNEGLVAGVRCHHGMQ